MTLLILCSSFVSFVKNYILLLCDFLHPLIPFCSLLVLLVLFCSLSPSRPFIINPFRFLWFPFPRFIYLYPLIGPCLDDDDDDSKLKALGSTSSEFLLYRVVMIAVSKLVSVYVYICLCGTRAVGVLQDVRMYGLGINEFECMLSQSG